MRCDEFEKRLNRLLDRRGPIHDSPLHDHARTCPDCCELLAGKPLLDALADGLPPLPANFASRTVARFCAGTAASTGSLASGISGSVSGVMPASLAEANRQRTANQGRRRWRLVSLGAIAAIVLLVSLLPGIRHRARGRSEFGGGAAVASTNRAAPLVIQRSARRGILAAVRPRTAETRMNAGPASPGSSPSSAAAVELESDELRQLFLQLWTNFPAMPTAPLEPIDRIAGGIRPLTSTLVVAWDVLRRSLPGGGRSESGSLPPPAQSSENGSLPLSELRQLDEGVSQLV